MIEVGVGGVGMVAPGIENWIVGRETMLADSRYDPTAPFPTLLPEMLPANERRRTTNHIKLALQCGQDAMSEMAAARPGVATVFASSGGDLGIMDKILTSLGQPGKPVSPTHFHNSVHNALAGYWSIATQSHAASTSISAHDASFAAGLLEAAGQVEVDGCPVLLIACDSPTPAALHPYCPLLAPFGVALLLVPGSDKWAVRIELKKINTFSEMDDPGLELLRNGNPAARSLPLLAQLASARPGQVNIPYLTGLGICLEVVPC